MQARRKRTYARIALHGGKYALVSIEDKSKLDGIRWYVDNYGYAVGYVIPLRKMVKMHRWILNAPKDRVVDHLNHDRLDNRRNNLRLITTELNSGHRKNKPKGVYYIKKKGKYLSQFCKNGKFKYVGWFSNKDEAEEAFNLAWENYQKEKSKRCKILCMQIVKEPD